MTEFVETPSPFHSPPGNLTDFVETPSPFDSSLPMGHDRRSAHSLPGNFTDFVETPSPFEASAPRTQGSDVAVNGSLIQALSTGADMHWHTLNGSNTTATPTSTASALAPPCPPGKRRFRVVAASYSDYRVSGNVSGLDPELHVRQGDLLHFEVNALGHPFWIKTINSTGQEGAIDNLPNNGLDSGTLQWVAPAAESDAVFFYTCEFHPGMSGRIVVSPCPRAMQPFRARSLPVAAGNNSQAPGVGSYDAPNNTNSSFPYAGSSGAHNVSAPALARNDSSGRGRNDTASPEATTPQPMGAGPEASEGAGPNSTAAAGDLQELLTTTAAHDGNASGPVGSAADAEGTGSAAALDQTTFGGTPTGAGDPTATDSATGLDRPTTDPPASTEPGSPGNASHGEGGTTTSIGATGSATERSVVTTTPTAETTPPPSTLPSGAAPAAIVTVALTLRSSSTSNSDLVAWVSNALGVPARYVDVRAGGKRRLLADSEQSFIVTITMPHTASDSVDLAQIEAEITKSVQSNGGAVLRIASSKKDSIMQPLPTDPCSSDPGAPGCHAQAPLVRPVLSPARQRVGLGTVLAVSAVVFVALLVWLWTFRVLYRGDKQSREPLYRTDTVPLTDVEGLVDGFERESLYPETDDDFEHTRTRV